MIAVLTLGASIAGVIVAVKGHTAVKIVLGVMAALLVAVLAWWIQHLVRRSDDA